MRQKKVGSLRSVLDPLRIMLWRLVDSRRAQVLWGCQDRRIAAGAHEYRKYLRTRRCAVHSQARRGRGWFKNNRVPVPTAAALAEADQPAPPVNLLHSLHSVLSSIEWQRSNNSFDLPKDSETLYCYLYPSQTYLLKEMKTVNWCEKFPAHVDRRWLPARSIPLWRQTW